MNFSRILVGIYALTLLLPAARALAEDAAPAQTPVLEEGDRPAKKPVKKKKKGFDYDKSKYKSKIEEPMGAYRFNEKGEVIDGEKKKPASKKKKKSEPPEVDPLKPAACGDEGSCLEKKSDADAL